MTTSLPVRPADGSTFLVTGAAGGIGAATLRALRAAGWQAVGADLPDADPEVALDVTDPSAVDSVVAEIAARPGGLAGVVTCAGIGVGGPVDTIDLDRWRSAIDVNLWGTIHPARAAYPHLMSAGRGHLVLVGSLAGLVPSPLLVPYATSKWGIVGLARSLAPEAHRHGVGVSTVCPGPVETPLLDAGREITAISGGFDSRRYLTDVAGSPLAADAVADAVVGVIGSKRVVVAPGRARAISRLGALAPGLTDRLVARSLARELARMAASA